MEILDRKAIEQLERDTSPEVVPVILERFLGELDQRCANLVSALEANDMERVGLEAHSVKSASRTFGLEVLAASAAELEATADGGNADTVATRAEAMQHAAGDARRALTAFLAGE